MIVALQPGDTLTITFADKPAAHQGWAPKSAVPALIDGAFTVDFDTKAHPGQLVIKEAAGLPGSEVGEANSILYHEDFQLTPEEQEARESAAKEVDVEPT